jgi:alpha-1,4-digalacturonate transport system permease protein
MTTDVKVRTPALATVRGAGRARRSRTRYGVFLLVLAVGIVIVLPVVFMASMAFKEPADIYVRDPTLLPRRITLDNFAEGWQGVNFRTFFGNSLLVTGVTVAVTVIINAMAGYAFAKFNFRGARLCFLLVLAAMMIPDQVRMIPLYSLMRWAGLLDTYASVILPALGATFGTFLMRQYIKTIPDEILSAARVDGCSEFQIFYRIILPLTKPALATNVVFQFLWSWNDLLFPLLFLRSEAKYTIQLALAFFGSGDNVTAGPIMAMSLLSILPVVLVFLLLQRYFVQGIASQGVKG